DAETVEAGEAFGATRGQILRGIQLPLAVPTIMAGVNQVIMLSLSMAVIAGMVGADGLGKEVVQAISTQDLALGVEAGIAVVILAVVLDHMNGAPCSPGDRRSSPIGLAQKAIAQRGYAMGAFGPAPWSRRLVSRASPLFRMITSGKEP